MNNYKKYFDKGIKNNYPDNFDEIITEIENNYKVISRDTKFAKASNNPLDKRLDFCGHFLARIKLLTTNYQPLNIILINLD